MEKIIGTTLWFGSNGISYGYIGWGEGEQIYIHYKQLIRKSLRDPSFREIKKGDVIEFSIGTGYHNSGTQAIEARLVTRCEDIDGYEGID